MEFIFVVGLIVLSVFLCFKLIKKVRNSFFSSYLIVPENCAGIRLSNKAQRALDEIWFLGKNFRKFYLNVCRIKNSPSEVIVIGLKKEFRVSFLCRNNVVGLFNEIFIQKIYAFETSQSSPFIIDGGGNIGMATLYFKDLYPNAKILVFEPAGKCYETLVKNIEQNDLKDITVINKALAGKEGEAFLYDSTANGVGAVSGTINEQLKSTPILPEKVCTTILSTYIHEQVDLLKLDIEAAEGDVIEDLKKADKLKFVKRIIMEYHWKPTVHNNNLPKILNTLEENKFNYEICGNQRINFTDAAGDFGCMIYAFKLG